MTVTLLDSGADTTPTASKTSGSFTPTAGALLVVGCYITAHTTFDAGGCTSSLAGYSFHRLEEHARGATNVNSCYWFVANQMAKATSQTVTISAGSDAGDGFAWAVYEVTPATRFGMEAIRGAGIHNNFAAAATPSITIDQNAVSTNPCFLFIGNNTNPGAVTAPTNFTRDVNTGYATPTTGFCANSRTSGHTANTITAGGTSATAGGACGGEIDVTTSQTIKPVSAGTVPATTGTGTGTTSCTPDYPPDLAEGDLITLTVAIKPSTATAPDLSGSGFTQVTNATGGTGSTGTDTGPMRLATYYRVAGSTPPTGTLTVTPGSSPNNCWAHMRAYRSSHGASTSWDVAGTTGDDTSAGAGVSTAFGADPGIAVDDLLEVSFATPTDVNLPGNFTRKFNDSALTGTGLTTGVISGDYASLFEPSTTNGQDSGGQITRFFPTAALTSGVPTYATTATGTTTNIAGPTALVRYRASAGDVEETPSPGGAIAAGTAPTATVPAVQGGAAAAGAAPGPSAAVPQGGAVAAGVNVGSAVTATPVPGGADAAGAAPSPVAPVAQGGATAQGVSPGTSATVTPGGTTAEGAGPVALVAVSPGGAIAGGTPPTDSDAVTETPTPGGALAGGTGPVASVTPGTGAAAAAGTSPTASSTVVQGGAIAAGAGPVSSAPVAQGGATAAGAAPVSSAAVGQGGADCAGNGAGSSVGCNQGGALAAGSPPSPYVTTTIGGAIVAANVITGAVVLVTPGGAIAGGTPPFVGQPVILEVVGSLLSPFDASAAESSDGPVGAVAAASDATGSVSGLLEVVGEVGDA